jgi:hypothetical protein
MLLSKTVVGLFESSGEVDRVVKDLEDAGTSRDNIKVADQRDFEAEGSLSEEELLRHRGTGIRGVLNRLFGESQMAGAEPGQDSALYADWVRNGGFLVAVDTDESHAENVSRIMERHAATEMTGRMGKTKMGLKAAEASMLTSEPLRRGELLTAETRQSIETSRNLN